MCVCTIGSGVAVSETGPALTGGGVSLLHSTARVTDARLQLSQVFVLRVTEE